MSKGQDVDVLRDFLRDLERAEKPHAMRVKRWAQCDDVYNAVLKPRENQWESDLHPPYALQIVETMISGLVDDEPKPKVQALLPGKDMAEAAKDLEKLLTFQREQDGWAEKQEEFVKQALIRGLTVAKVPWVNEAVRCERRIWSTVMTETGAKQVSRMEPYTHWNRWPGFVPWDVNDFLVDPAARSMDDAAYVIARTYDTRAQLRLMEKAGVYSRVDEVATAGERLSEAPGGRDLHDRVEVLERWKKTADGIQVTTLANRATIIRDEASPFGHGMLPFVAASTMPNLFRFDGKSEVEIIADLQAMLWELQNQRLDNVKLINNCVVILREGADANQEFKLYPGAVNSLPNPSTDVAYYSPPTHLLDASIKAEEAIKGDMQTISPANAYMSGADSSQIDQSTATGISLIQTMAQRRLLRKKRIIENAKQRAGQMQIALNQQLLVGIAAVPMQERGIDDFHYVDPAKLQGRFLFTVDDVAESMNMQQKRSEALAKASFFMSNIPAFQLAGIDVAAMVKTIAEDVSEAFGEQPDKYVKLAPPMPMMAAPPGAAPGGAPVPNMANNPDPGAGLGTPTPLRPPVPAGVG